MKILIVGSIYSLLMNELIGKMNNGDHEIHVLDILHREFVSVDELYFTEVERKRGLLAKKSTVVGRAHFFLRSYLHARQIIRRNRFDIINIHGTHFYYFLLSGLFKNHSGKFISSIYGSEFYKAGKMKRQMLSMILKRSTWVTFTNELTAQDFNRYYDARFSNKIRICRFGLQHLDIIEKIKYRETKTELRKKLRLPDDKLIITCGYGRSKNNQHEKIIHAILDLSPLIKKEIFLLFPMTYGNDTGQIGQVRELLSDSGIPYLINEKFLDDEMACSFVVAADIMINVPVTDQLNAAMQEMLYTGNLVINGAWLPYEILDRSGIEVLKVNDTTEITERIKEVFEKKIRIESEKNRKIIRELSSWELTIHSWIDLYNGTI